MHLMPCPRPIERMFKPLIVLWPTDLDMLNQVLARCRLKMLQVFICECSQQQLGLIEPTRMRGRVQRSKSLVRRQILARVMIYMRWPIIHYQMYLLGSCPTSRDLTQCPQIMLVVVCLKAASPHHSIQDIKRYQQYYCAMSLVLEFASRNLPRSHCFGRLDARQSLNVRLLVNTDNQFPAPVQPQNSLITPQDSCRSLGEFFVYCGRLPVPTAMGLQTGRLKYACNSRIMNPFNDGLFNYNLLESAAIPSSQMASISTWVSAGDSLDLDPLDRGKKLGAARYVLRQRSHQRRDQGNASIDRIEMCGLMQANAQSQRCAHHDPKPAGHALCWQYAGSVGPEKQFRSGIGDHWHRAYIRSVFALSPCSVPPCGEAYFGEGKNSICSKTYATVH